MFHGFAEDRGQLPEITIVAGGCWLWTRAANGKGYGRWWKRDSNYQRPAHLVLWETFNGPVPIGMQLDHLCRVRRCVNPAHLELVTLRENCRRRDEANGRGAA